MHPRLTAAIPALLLGDGEFPVVLIRTPYDKSHPLGKTLAERFTAQGIAMVAQDCRGHLASEGTFYASRDERKDGLECLEREPALVRRADRRGAGQLQRLHPAGGGRPARCRQLREHVRPHPSRRALLP